MASAPPDKPDALGTDAWFTPGRFVLILFALLFAAFPGVMTLSETFVYRDFGYVTYPFAKYFRDCFWSGEPALWNPYTMCGLPFLAQWNTQALYPPALFYLLVPLEWSLPLFCVGHLLVGGLGVYFLAHRWGASRFAASVAGVAFAFSGMAISFLTWVHTAAAFGLMPWVVLLVERAWREGGKLVPLAAIIGALQMLTGSPEIIFLTWCLLAAMALAQVSSFKFQVPGSANAAPLTRPPGTLSPSDGERDGVRGRFAHPSRFRPELVSLGRFVAVVLLVAALSAAQLLPFLDFLAHSNRGTGFGGSDWSMPWWGWASLLVPLFRCYRLGGAVFVQDGQLWIPSYYLGIGVLALVVLAVVAIRTPRVRFLAVVMVLSLVMALGESGFLFTLVRKLLPPLGFMRFPVKYAMLAVFIAPLLAALALTRWEMASAEERRPLRRWLLGWSGAGLAIIGFVLWAAVAYRMATPHVHWPHTWDSGLSRAAILVVTLGVLLALPRTTTPQLRWCWQIGLLLLVWADLQTQTWVRMGKDQAVPAINPVVANSIYDPGWMRLAPAPSLGKSRAMVSPAANRQFFHTLLSDPTQDFQCHRLGLYANCNLLEDVPKVNGFYSLYPRELFEVLAPVYMPTNDCPAPLADFFGASHVTSPANPFEWEPRPSKLPLVTAGQRPVFAGRDATLKALMSESFKPREEIYLPFESKSQITVTNSGPARVISSRFFNHRVEAEVEAAAPSLVVISQTYYHWWKAFLDGHEVTLLRANHSFQALEVPAGRHQVVLRYVDRSFQLGAVISLLALGACVAVLMRRPKVLPA
jgi:hypothetical protein